MDDIDCESTHSSICLSRKWYLKTTARIRILFSKISMNFAIRNSGSKSVRSQEKYSVGLKYNTPTTHTSTPSKSTLKKIIK